MDQPLVSVIIPCYNYGKYLPDAFESVRSQDYPNIEVIVVDDGSTDETKEICEKYSQVKYIYQTNQGLSAARNTGIKISNGEFLIFLDADDWLLPNAVANNLPFLLQDEEFAFVSGGYEVRYTETGKIHNSFEVVESDHYLRLLQGNYVGVPATAMYRRRIFDEVLFDTILKSCQDYDLYLKITRKYPVFHHSKKIAAYRIHSSNMSSNFSAMLSESLQVLERQKKDLRTTSEREAYEKGRVVWKNWYCRELFRNMCYGNTPVSAKNLMFIIKNSPLVFFLFFGSLLDHYRLAGFDGIRFLFKKKYKKNELISLKVNWLKHVFFLRNNTSDIPKFYEVFQSKGYDFNFDFDPQVIIDCGAHIGLESIVFANKFPNALIYSIELDKDVFEILLKNTQEYSNIKCLNYGIWNKSTNLKVMDAGSDSWGLIAHEVSENGENTVEAFSIEEIMKRHCIDRIDICKINIGGLEKELFAEKCENWLPKTKAIMIDLHDRMREGCSKSFFDALADYEFTVVPSGSYIVSILK